LTIRSISRYNKFVKTSADDVAYGGEKPSPHPLMLGNTDGAISIDGLKRHIDRYLKHFSLNDYDIVIMPYILYFQHIIMHYSPPYNDIVIQPKKTLFQNTNKFHPV